MPSYGSDGLVLKRYIDDLTKLNEQTDIQHQRDSEGLHRFLTEDSYDDFLQLYEKCVSDGESVLASMSKDDPAYSIVLNIHKLILSDFGALKSFNKNDMASGKIDLKKVIDKSRTRITELKTVNIATDDKGKISRIPIEYVDSQGTRRKGVFSKKHKVDIIGGYEAILGMMHTKYPQISVYVDSYLSGSIIQFASNAQKCNFDVSAYTDAMFLMGAMANLYDRNMGAITHQSMMKAFKFAEPDLFDSLRDSIKTFGEDPLSDYAEKVDGLYNSVRYNNDNAMIENGCRLDTRNAAMYAVASLFGCPDVIAYAEPMKLKTENSEQEGTFLGEGEGEDVLSLSTESIHYGDVGSESFKNTNGLKSIADIQVIDFICGNVDRHTGNMLYKFDKSDPDVENHKFTGVQGVGNETCFGLYVPKDSKSSVMHFTALDNLNVISQSMAEKISAANPAYLSTVLRNNGLSVKQIKAACERLTILQKYIADSVKYYEKHGEELKEDLKDPGFVARGTVRIIPDDKFSELDIEKLSVTRVKGKNAFSAANKFHAWAVSEEVMKDNFEKEEPVENFPVQGVIMSEQEVTRAHLWAQNVKNATGPKGSSKQFDAFRDAVIQYEEFCELNKGSLIPEDVYKIRRGLLKNIVKTSRDYISYKKDVSNPNEYTKNRLNIACSIGLNAGKDYMDHGYREIKKGMNPEEQRRMADGLHRVEELSIDNFNAKMRAMAQEIERKSIMQNELKGPDA